MQYMLQHLNVRMWKRRRRARRRRRRRKERKTSLPSSSSSPSFTPLCQRLLPQKQRRDELQKAVRKELECEIWEEKQDERLTGAVFAMLSRSVSRKHQTTSFLYLPFLLPNSCLRNVHCAHSAFTSACTLNLKIVCVLVRDCVTRLTDWQTAWQTVSTIRPMSPTAEWKYWNPTCSLQHYIWEVLSWPAQMFKCVHVLREDKTHRMRPRGHSQGEITEMYRRIGAHWGRGGGLRRTWFILQFCEGSFECICF